MRYWWVNQKQTYRQEVGGGYLWSPKRRADGGRNQFYENMKGVAPGDLVFSYWNAAIRAYGMVRSFGYDAPKPDEFGPAGRHWAEIGYRADVEYVVMTTPVAPRDELARIASLLPAKYSPLHPMTGKGYQSVYLAALPEPLGVLIWEFVTHAFNPMIARDSTESPLRSSEDPERQRWEEHEIQSIDASGIAETEREAIIRARRWSGGIPREGGAR